MNLNVLNWLKDVKSRYVHPNKLAKIGVLGMNERNIAYISRYNPRRLYPLVDDKLQTKEIVLEAGVNAPILLGQSLNNIRLMICSISSKILPVFVSSLHMVLAAKVF